MRRLSGRLEPTKSSLHPLKPHHSKSQKMGSRALLLLKATTAETLLFTSKSTFSKALIRNSTRSFSTRSALLPPDLPRLAETARISLTPHEVPKVLVLEVLFLFLKTQKKKKRRNFQFFSFFFSLAFAEILVICLFVG